MAADDPELAALLLSSEVYGKPFSLPDLIDRLRLKNRVFLLRGLSMIGTLTTNVGGRTGRSQRNLARELLSDDPAAHAKAESLFAAGEADAVLFSDAVLEAVGLALKHGSEEGDEGGELFGPLLLGANELVTTRPDDTLEDLAAIVLHGHVLDETAQLRYLIPRYYDLLVTRSRSASGGFDLDRLFTEASGGLTLPEFLALSLVAYAMYRRFSTAKKFGEVQYGTVLEDIERRVLTPEKWGLYRALVEMPFDESVALFAGATEGRLGFSQFAKIRERPLVRVSTTETFPIWLPWLGSKVADDARWLLASTLRGDRRAIAELDGFLGKLFEAYAFNLLARCYPTDGPLQSLFPPRKYETQRGEEKSNDATLFSGTQAVFFEMTISHPRFVDLWNGDVDRYKTWLRDGFVEGRTAKLAKLSRRVADFRSGHLRFNGMDPRSITRIYPVVITLLPWPRHDIIAMVTDAVLSPLAPFGGDPQLTPSVAPPVFVSIEELEMLEESLKTGIALVEVLKSWETSPHQHSSLKNHLLFDRGFAESPNEYLRGKFVEVTTVLKDEAQRLVAFDQQAGPADRNHEAETSPTGQPRRNDENTPPN